MPRISTKQKRLNLLLEDVELRETVGRALSEELSTPCCILRETKVYRILDAVIKIVFPMYRAQGIPQGMAKQPVPELTKFWHEYGKLVRPLPPYEALLATIDEGKIDTLLHLLRRGCERFYSDITLVRNRILAKDFAYNSWKDFEKRAPKEEARQQNAKEEAKSTIEQLALSYATAFKQEDSYDALNACVKRLFPWWKKHPECSETSEPIKAYELFWRDIEPEMNQVTMCVLATQLDSPQKFLRELKKQTGKCRASSLKTYAELVLQAIEEKDFKYRTLDGLLKYTL